MRTCSLCLAVILAGCSSSADVSPGLEGDGGDQAAGAGGAQAGGGGRAADGGAAGKAGAANTGGSSGATGSGGATGTGGATGSGGATGTGGATGSGGSTGTGGSTGSAGATGVILTPKAITVTPNSNFTFYCWVRGAADNNCTFSMQEVPGASPGPYFYARNANGQPLAPGTYHVVATSVADPTLSDVATVHVTANQSLSIGAVNVVAPGGRQSFLCGIQGFPSRQCDWSVMEGTSGGSVIRQSNGTDDVGSYTAPETPGIYHVVATSHDDPTKQASAAILVRTPSAGNCSNPAPVGQWEEITPAQHSLPGPYGASWGEPGSRYCWFGYNAFGLAPNGDLYLGTCGYGVWKSTDCGSTWTHANVGSDWTRDGAALDNSSQWTYAIDPRSPTGQVQYTNAGYNGNTSGMLRSDDWAVHWSFIWPPRDGSYASLVTGNFVSVIPLDPTNPDHALIGFHQDCNRINDNYGTAGQGPYTIGGTTDKNGPTKVTSMCYAETWDASAASPGPHWTIRNQDPTWVGSEAQNPSILDQTHFIIEIGQSTGGIYSTSNSGASWTRFAPGDASHWASQAGQGGYKASNGYWYVPGNYNMWRSTNGGDAWASIPNWPSNLTISVQGDGTTIWATGAGNLGPVVPPTTPVYYQTAESDGLTWKPSTFDTSRIPWGGFLNGAQMNLVDRTRHILYGIHGATGMYRVKYQ